MMQEVIKMIVNAPRLNVRQKPNTESDVICIVEKDVVLEVTSKEKDGWCRITTPLGRKGYVMTRHIKEGLDNG